MLQLEQRESHREQLAAGIERRLYERRQRDVVELERQRHAHPRPR